MKSYYKNNISSGLYWDTPVQSWDNDDTDESQARQLYVRYAISNQHHGRGRYLTHPTLVKEHFFQPKRGQLNRAGVKNSRLPDVAFYLRAFFLTRIGAWSLDYTHTPACDGIDYSVIVRGWVAAERHNYVLVSKQRESVLRAADCHADLRWASYPDGVVGR